MLIILLLLVPSSSGSHGDGDPQNTETPIVVWGSGVRGPESATPEDDVDDGVLFVDQHSHHEKTPDSWGLKNVERTDINQGDIAPLMVRNLSKYMDNVASCALSGLLLMSLYVVLAVNTFRTSVSTQFSWCVASRVFGS